MTLRIKTPSELSSEIVSLNTRLAKKDAALKQARSALATAQSEMRDLYSDHPSRIEVDAALRAIDECLSEKP